MGGVHVTLRLYPQDPVGHAIEQSAGCVPPEGALSSGHLTQWITVERAHIDRVEAHYLFDDVYAKAHPESVEPAHLAMLQALLTAKLFDDGELVVTLGQLSGSLLWPGVDAPRRSFKGA